MFAKFATNLQHIVWYARPSTAVHKLAYNRHAFANISWGLDCTPAQIDQHSTTLMAATDKSSLARSKPCKDGRAALHRWLLPSNAKRRNSSRKCSKRNVISRLVHIFAKESFRTSPKPCGTAAPTSIKTTFGITECPRFHFAICCNEQAL